ncbi:Uncharacterized protein Rs2_29951 [Raphanus sativus]|nr:Uncharacterized protein Rs2_29951 [Raphanus sativus]
MSSDVVVAQSVVGPFRLRRSLLLGFSIFGTRKTSRKMAWIVGVLQKIAALTLLAPVAAGDWTNARPLSGTSGRKVSPKVTETEMAKQTNKEATRLALGETNGGDGFRATKMPRRTSCGSNVCSKFMSHLTPHNHTPNHVSASTEDVIAFEEPGVAFFPNKTYGGLKQQLNKYLDLG